MSDPYPRESTGRVARGTTRLVAAVLAWTINPIILLITVWPTGTGRDCSSPSGLPDYLPPGVRGRPGGAGGIDDAGRLGARHRSGRLGLRRARGVHRRFVRGHVVPAILVTVAAPWAMAGYAPGMRSAPASAGWRSPSPAGPGHEPADNGGGDARPTIYRCRCGIGLQHSCKSRPLTDGDGAT
jgi:hypothetical protein